MTRADELNERILQTAEAVERRSFDPLNALIAEDAGSGFVHTREDWPVAHGIERGRFTVYRHRSPDCPLARMHPRITNPESVATAVDCGVCPTP